MLRCRYLPFNATQHVRYLHEMVIDNIGKMIGGVTITFHNNWIAFIIVDIIIDTAINHVVQTIDIRAELESVISKCWSAIGDQIENANTEYKMYRKQCGVSLANFSATCSAFKCLHRLSYPCFCCNLIACLRKSSSLRSVQKHRYAVPFSSNFCNSLLYRSRRLLCTYGPWLPPWTTLSSGLMPTHSGIYKGVHLFSTFTFYRIWIKRSKFCL